MQILSTIGAWAAPLILVLASTIVVGKKNARLQGIIAIMTFFWASLLGAIRFETGDDWQGYENYYVAINTSLGLIDAYLSDPLMLQFEPGYYLIAYGAKLANLPYTAVNFISVFSLFLAIVYFLKRAYIPPYFVVLVFLGLPLINLFYNQVRQCIAVAFILLAIQAKNDRSFIALCCFAFLFQFSTAIFALLAFLARLFESSSLKAFRIGLIAMPIVAFVFASGIIDPYEVLKFWLPENLKFKIDIYQEEDTSIGALRFVSIGYLLFVANYYYIKMSSLTALTPLEKRTIVSALLCTLLIPYSIILFPNSYAFYGRTFTFSLIILSISASIIHKRSFKEWRVKDSSLPNFGLGLLSYVYYIATLINYPDIYIPYRSIFHA